MKQRYQNTAYICFIIIALVLFAGAIGAANPLDAFVAILIWQESMASIAGGYAKAMR